jgi:hypothetical protein
MSIRVGLAATVVFIAVQASADWEYVVGGSEITAVLLAENGDVISAGVIGDPVLAPWELAITRHAAADGAVRWRHALTNTGPLYQWGVSLARAPGNAYVAVTHQRERYQEFTGSIVKVSSDGTEQWRHDPTDHVGFYSVAVDKNGDVVAAGAISPLDPNDHDLIVLKVSGDTGAELWRRVITGVEDSVFDRFSSVAVDSQGQVFAGGELFADAVLGFPDFFVVKLAGESGEEVWRRFVPSLSGHGGHAAAVAVDANDDLIAGGWAVLVAWCDFTIAKFDGTSGDELWRIALDENGNCDDAQALAIDAVGDVVATGDIGNKLATAKFAAATGTLLWRYDVPHLSGCSGGGCASGRSVRVDQAGNALVAGNARGPSSSEMTAALLARDSGDPIWLRRIDFELCDDLAFSSDINVGGDIALGGIAYSQSGGMCTWPGGGQFALVKIFGDQDADTVKNDTDNCTADPNPGQIDSDLDGFGNACDADYDGDGTVSPLDLGLFKSAYLTLAGQPGYDPMFDADSDGCIGATDLVAFKGRYLRAPGPSGLGCAGTTPCAGN